jgi:N-acetylglucosaminyldiphosphoundecaprenol N-acetyl-beta-D-mannosaminyltransferase
MYDKYNVIGIEINSLDIKCIYNIFKDNDYTIPKYVCILNSHLFVISKNNSVLEKTLNNAWITLSDGKPISIIANILYGKNLFSRITGPDLLKFLLEKSERLNITHYFLGSTPETLNKIKIKVKSYNKYIKGYHSPSFGEIKSGEIDKIFCEINNLRPDIIWIGLGAPRQEEFINENIKRLNYGIMIGVGAAFDYFAGNLKRAPNWMQILSLEWLYRLFQEPRRLWKRYLITNTLFVYYAIKELIERKILKK